MCFCSLVLRFIPLWIVAKTERLVFGWQRSHSEASKRGWEGRWERGEAVGPKGSVYLKDIAVAGPYFREDFDDFDIWDFEGEY